jgi:hypothetical protein
MSKHTCMSGHVCCLYVRSSFKKFLGLVVLTVVNLQQW